MEKCVEIKRPSGIMRGMIHYPDSGSGPFPALVVFHGFQGNRMGDESLFVALSRFLAASGFASVRFDFMGSGESEGSFGNATITGELDDALSVIEWAAADPGIDPKRIAILGHSMGGSIAGMFAGLIESGAIRDPGARINTVILLAPAGEIKDRINEGIARRGFPVTIDSPLFHTVKFPVPVGGEMVEKSFFTDLKKYSVMEATARYSGPITLIQGDEDHVVPLHISQLYQTMIPQCTLLMIKGTGHKFNNASSRRELFGLIVEHLTHYL